MTVWFGLMGLALNFALHSFRHPEAGDDSR